MIAKHKSIILTTTIAAFIAAPAAAQDALKGLGVEAGVSSLGVYIAPKYQFSDKVTGRVPLYMGSRSLSEKVEGNMVTGNFDAASSAIMADLHPFSGAFRVSGGVGLNGYTLKGTIANPVFNNTTYNATVDATIKQTNDIVPIISIGYSKSFKNGLGVVAELGAKLGTYSMTVTDTNIPTLLKTQFNADVAKTNADLQKTTMTPFVTLGLSYRF